MWRSVTDWERKSLRNVMSLSCAVATDDTPQEVSLTLSLCGFSHNVLRVTHMNVQQGVVTPSRRVGVCVRPISQSRLDAHGMTTQRVALWLEYLRSLGADKVHTYVATISQPMQRLVDFYHNETFSILSSYNWTAVDMNVDLVVSDEAAVNHCIYHNMMAYEYIIVLSIQQWLGFSGSFDNLKQMVGSDEFESKMSVYGGLRIRSFDEDTRQMFIVKPRLVLATAARHFIALMGRTSFHVMDAKDVVGTHYEHRTRSRSFVRAEKQLQQLLQHKAQVGHF